MRNSLVLFFASVFIFSFLHWQWTPQFLGYTTLRGNQDCELAIEDVGALVQTETISASGDDCQVSFRSLGGLLRLHVMSHSAESLSEIIVYAPNGSELLRKRLENTKGKWFELEFSVPIAESIRLAFELPSQTDSVALRTRASFYRSHYFSGLFARYDLGLLSCLVLTLGLMQLLLTLSRYCTLSSSSFLSWRGSLGLLLALTFWFLRPSLFFFYDDWTVLERFSNLGLEGAFLKHNEHLPVLASAIAWLESVFFGKRYQLYLMLSLGIHLFNGFLLSKLLLELDRKDYISKVAASSTVVLFLFSGLHTENLQWEVCKQMLLTLTGTLLSLLFAVRYLKSSSISFLPLIALSTLAATLSMSTGLVVCIILPLFLCCYAGLLEDSRREPQLMMRSVIASCSCLVGLLPLVFFLLQGPKPASQLSAASVSDFLSFIFIGTQYGTFTRAFAGPFLPIAHHSIVAFGFGLVCNLLLLLAGLILARDRCKAAAYWLIAQLFIFSPFLLFALGRASMGAGASLALRYQLLPAVGLAFAVYPIVRKVVDLLVSNSRGFKSTTLNQLNVAVGCSLFFYFFLQISQIEQNAALVKSGLANRVFLQEVRSWNDLLSRKPFQLGPFYEGTGSERLGQYPVMAGEDGYVKQAIVHPDMMIKSLNF